MATLVAGVVDVPTMAPRGLPRGELLLPMKVDLGDERRKEMQALRGAAKVSLVPAPSCGLLSAGGSLEDSGPEDGATPLEGSSQVDLSFLEEVDGAWCPEEEVDPALAAEAWASEARWDEAQLCWLSCHEEAWGGAWWAHAPHGHFGGAAAQLLASGLHPACWAAQWPQGAASARPARPQAGTPAATPSKAASKAAKAKARAAVERESATKPDEATTVMMRNLPNKYTRDSLLELLAGEGFAGLYDLVYLPVDFNTQVGLGYAFVNLITPADAKRFGEHFDGFSAWTGVFGSQKVCKVSWSDAVQGVEAHVERYRNSPVMHASVPDEYKPQLFKDGLPIPFPAPTGRVKAPRARRSGYLPS